MNDTTMTTREIQAALAAPFGKDDVRFRPGATSGNRALALAYVSARAVMQRLDDVLGIDGWRDAYECLADGSVLCKLSVRLGETWITKCDAGGPSEQPDESDRRKSAFSDSLKRAAVKFGVARYLGCLAPIWCDYDPKAKKFIKSPPLPGVPTRPAA